MRGAFYQDPDFARKMANKRWRNYRRRKAFLERKLRKVGVDSRSQ
jgi:hypothetical protein